MSWFGKPNIPFTTSAQAGRYEIRRTKGVELLAALRAGNQAAAVTLIDEGADLTAEQLAVALQNRLPMVALKIVENPEFDINKAYEELVLGENIRKTPLMVACIYNSEPVVSALLKRGADVYKRRKQIIEFSTYQSALTDAFFAISPEVAVMLISVFNKDKKAIRINELHAFVHIYLLAEDPTVWHSVLDIFPKSPNQHVLMKEFNDRVKTHRFDRNAIQADATFIEFIRELNDAMRSETAELNRTGGRRRVRGRKTRNNRRNKRGQKTRRTV